ncbi:MAG: rubredoxin [Ginsengibacter sp.]
MQTQSITINFTGGIISPGFLKDILEIAGAARVLNVRFGLRQQMIMNVPVKYFASFSVACAERGIEFYKTREAFPNIVSSYPAAGIFGNENWLREGVYKDIFNTFDFTPQLKINICDSNQSFIPFFTGNINWISSSSQHFWHLYIRFPKTQKIFRWSELVYTNDIATLSRNIETLIFYKREKFYRNENADGNVLFEEIKLKNLYTGKASANNIELPKFSLSYYEGFNKHDNNYWLGVYRRNELFPVPFLIDVCDVCMQTRIGQLYTTPWKSIIIKGIDSEHRSMWDYVLGKYRINVRHAANELNWQVEDEHEDSLQLKRLIIRYFDKEDVRTYGLCFAVQIKPASGMFGSVIIRKQQNKNRNRLRSLERFDILYSPDFNPNSSELVMFRESVEKDHIGTYIVSLCKIFYEKAGSTDFLEKHAADKTVQQTIQPAATKFIHQCSHCFTVYDEEFGDDENNIKAGTSFEKLPSSYQCPLCESGKEDFVEVEEAVN